MNDEHQWPQQDHEQALVIEDDDYSYAPSEADLEAGTLEESAVRRKSSQLNRASVEDPLLQRRDSIKSDPCFQMKRISQKIYIVTEDLTIVVAGYTNSRVSSLILMIISVMTLGLGYLVMRWIPRWRIALIGKPMTLQDCDWMVVEVINTPSSWAGTYGF